MNVERDEILSLLNALRGTGQRYVSGAPSTPGPLDSQVTVLISSSPVPSNPSTAIIEETLASVRFHFPTAKALIMLDGLRDDQAAMRERYEEFARRIEWNCENIWSNTWPVGFVDHHHQAGTTRASLEHVTTPLVLFVEHDTPLISVEIPWMELAQSILDGDCNSVRFPPDIEDSVTFAKNRAHLMLDSAPVRFHDKGAPIMRTIDWSQRPHLVLADYYRRVLREHFRPGQRAFIELPMVAAAASEPWEKNKLVVYAPPVGPIARSYHLDARAGDSWFNED